jgi:hypothetical protein
MEINDYISLFIVGIQIILLVCVSFHWLSPAQEEEVVQDVEQIIHVIRPELALPTKV